MRHTLFGARHVRTPLSVRKCTCSPGPLTITSVTVAVFPSFSFHSILLFQVAGLCSLFLIQILSPRWKLCSSRFDARLVLASWVLTNSLFFSLFSIAFLSCSVSSASCSLSVFKALVSSCIFLSSSICFRIFTPFSRNNVVKPDSATVRGP